MKKLLGFLAMLFLAYPAQAMDHSAMVQQACPHIAPLHDAFDNLDAGGTEDEFFDNMDELIEAGICSKIDEVVKVGPVIRVHEKKPWPHIHMIRRANGEIWFFVAVDVEQKEA